MKSNGLLLKATSVFSAVCVCSSIYAADSEKITPEDLTPKQLKDIDTVRTNQSIIPEAIIPKTGDYSNEDELPIPEGVKPIQGMNLPLNMKEINIYGLDHKPYGVAFLRQAFNKAIALHNNLEGAPKVRPDFKIRKKGRAYSVLINSETYLALVYAVAQEITKKYQSDQFLLARAIVPEQKINQKSGSVEICVAEGYLSENPRIVIPSKTKNTGSMKAKLAPYLNHLKNMKPLDFRRLERALLLVRDMSGIDVKTTFKQVAKKQSVSKKSLSICENALNNGAGSTALEVRANVDHYDGEISVDNFGTESLGPEIIRFRTGVNSKFKAGDRYSISVSNSTDSNETLSFVLNAQIPFGLNGFKAKFFHSDGDAQPGGFEELVVNNDTQVTGVSIEYPYIRSRKKNLTFDVGIRNHQVTTDSSAGRLESSKLNTLRFRSTYDFSDKYNGINLISAELVAGISGSLVTVPERIALDENFIKVRGELARYQSIGLSEKSTGSLTWINSLSWQYTNDPLFASEEFALGGRDYGRGYDLAVITGDQAIALKSELQYSNKIRYGKYKLYGFIDYGKVRNLGSEAIAQDERNLSLSSTGLGVDFESQRNWFAKLELTTPIDNKPDIDDADTQAYFQLGYRW